MLLGTVFKAPVKGVYAVEGSVRFDNAEGHYFRLVIAKNGDMDALNDSDMGDTINGYLRSGLAAIRADGEYKRGYTSYPLSIPPLHLPLPSAWRGC